MRGRVKALAEREGFEATFRALPSHRLGADLAWKLLESQPYSPESGFDRIVSELGPHGQFCPQFVPNPNGGLASIRIGPGTSAQGPCLHAPAAPARTSTVFPTLETSAE